VEMSKNLAAVSFAARGKTKRSLTSWFICNSTQMTRIEQICADFSVHFSFLIEKNVSLWHQNNLKIERIVLWH
jgi:hypothetical protein